MRRLLFFGMVCGVVTTTADLAFVFAHHLSPTLVIAGTHIGMLGLALYGVAYRAFEVLLPGWAGRVVWLAGALGGALGAAVHGLTGLAILNVRPGETGTFLVPSETFAAAPALIPPLWAFLALLGVIGSIGFAVVVGRGRSSLPRWAALLNPALLSVAVSLMGLLSPSPEAAIALSANIAHVFFFGGLLLASPRTAREAS